MFRLHLLLLASLIATDILHRVVCDQGDEIIDLTYSFDENTLYFPSDMHAPFVQEIFHRGPYGPLWLESNMFTTGEHTGTHMDAPAHLSEGRLRMDEVPVGHLIGPGVKIDMSSKASTNPDALLDVKDLIAWEEENGPIPNGAILMVFTDWGKFYPNRTAYFGSDRNDTFTDSNGNSLLHFPGVSPDAADWLIENRNIVGLGIDTASFDYGQSITFPSHEKLFKANIFGLENVANLDKMPTTGSTVYALPMKIKEGSGAPVRILAVVGDASNSAHTIACKHFIVFGTIFLFIAFIINC
ncbi:isatin hydrolase-like [Anneissia japonica]|uniref:isatin hydrolase-like n=1 Tax=Anneissia japonica TaxID=1529436 RepID=UPI0014256015|nr:isatin hydrolase-like [Anneissia japonica]XP_033127563.1 isatin hydrolase-like [Anneissia japonica]XP_033127564.1 isatin hydrolase-like [Anneissia japonica]